MTCFPRKSERRTVRPRWSWTAKSGAGSPALSMGGPPRRIIDGPSARTPTRAFSSLAEVPRLHRHVRDRRGMGGEGAHGEAVPGLQDPVDLQDGRAHEHRVVALE